jgi:mitotic spindle assembly checkpoint protein MAD1
LTAKLTPPSPCADNELSTTKRALARALHDLEEANHASARKQLDFDSQLSALNAQLTEAHARTDRLERHRSLLLAKERTDTDAANATRAELEAARAAAQDDARRAREECSALRDKHASLGERERELAHRTRQAELEASSAVGRVAGLEEALEAERAAVRERSAQLVKEQAARRELEVKLSETELAKPAEGGNVELIKDELHRQVGYLRTLEKENQRLTRKVELMDKNQANVEVLREENKALEKKVRHVEELRHQVAELEMQLQVAEREKKEWSAHTPHQLRSFPLGQADSRLRVCRQSFLGNSASAAEFNTPQQLAKALAATRIESASYLERVDTLKLELGTRDRLVGQLEATISGLQNEVAKATKDAESARGREKAAEQRMELLRQEIGMLKRHLDSYAAEESIHQAGNFDAQKSARLVELEQLLEAHKAEEVRLAGQVSHYRAVAEKYGGTTGEIEVREKNEGGAVSESLKALLEKNAQLEQGKHETACPYCLTDPVVLIRNHSRVQRSRTLLKRTSRSTRTSRRSKPSSPTSPPCAPRVTSTLPRPSASSWPTTPSHSTASYGPTPSPSSRPRTSPW